MIKKLYITHPETDLSLIDSNSMLLDSIDKINLGEVFHTSLGDLSYNDIMFVSNQFNEIDFVDLNFNPQSVLWHETEILLRRLSLKFLIKNFNCPEIQSFLSDSVHRSSDNNILWVITTNDTKNPDDESFIDDETYIRLGAMLNASTQIISKTYSLTKLLNLISHIPFQEGDKFICQLPGFDIENVSCNGIFYSTSTQDNEILFSPDYYTVEQYFYNYFTLFKVMIKYLRTLPINFTMFYDSFGIDELSYKFRKELVLYKEYCLLPPNFKQTQNEQILYKNLMGL